MLADWHLVRGGLRSIFITSLGESLISNARPLDRGNEKFVHTPADRERVTGGEGVFQTLLTLANSPLTNSTSQSTVF